MEAQYSRGGSPVWFSRTDWLPREAGCSPSQMGSVVGQRCGKDGCSRLCRHAAEFEVWEFQSSAVMLQCDSPSVKPPCYWQRVLVTAGTQVRWLLHGGQQLVGVSMGLQRQILRGEGEVFGGKGKSFLRINDESQMVLVEEWSEREFIASIRDIVNLGQWERLRG